MYCIGSLKQMSIGVRSPRLVYRIRSDERQGNTADSNQHRHPVIKELIKRTFLIVRQSIQSDNLLGVLQLTNPCYSLQKRCKPCQTSIDTRSALFCSARMQSPRRRVFFPALPDRRLERPSTDRPSEWAHRWIIHGVPGMEHCDSGWRMLRVDLNMR